jgi:hypothetical protein
MATKSGHSRRKFLLAGTSTGTGLLIAGIAAATQAGEDTVLFPAIRSVMTAKEFDEMGDRFEEREHQLFGEHGFEDVVAQVAEFEKTLGIYELHQFTAKVPAAL